MSELADVLEDLAAALGRPLLKAGDRVTVDGRRGTLVRVESPWTCSTTYVVRHWRRESRYVVSDFDPARPVVEGAPAVPPAVVGALVLGGLLAASAACMAAAFWLGYRAARS